MPRPTFALCGTFAGNTDVTAERWLSKFDFEMEDYQDSEGRFPAAKYLGYLNMLLVEDAAKWSEKDPDARRLLAEAKSAPTEATVNNFRTVFCEAFPSREIEASPIPFEVELAELHQRPNEALSAYYKRVSALMKGVGAKDRPASTPASPGLSPLESAFLDTVLRAFIRGLTDQEIRKEATRGMAQADRSLLGIYSLAEEARRTSLEIQKLLDEEAKTDELQFYKSLVQKNLPQQQVASLLASYHATRTPRSQPQQQAQQRWTFHTDPPQPAAEMPISNELPKPSAATEYRQPERPSYGSETPRPLLQNPNRGNAGRNANPSTSKPRNYQPTPRDMPDRSSSKNPFINGTLFWHSGDGLLCVKCGTKGHGARSCDSSPLPAWEQSYLRMVVFGDNPQVNFATVGFGEYDGAVRPYGTELRKPSTASTSSVTSSTTGQNTPSSSSIDSYVSPSSNSLQFGVAGLLTQAPSAETKAAEAMLGEGSGPNKRAHVEEAVDPTLQAGPSLRQQGKQPDPRFQQQIPVPQIPVPQQPQYYVPQQPSTGAMEDEEQRPKRKAKKRTGKKVEPQPLVGMFNGTSYENPVSIRQVLQNTRIDLSWMDFVAWSPAACRELKRLCTRVPKKRIPKAATDPTKAPPQPTQAPIFQPAFPQQVPQMPFVPLQSVPQIPTFQPQQVPLSQQSSQQTLGNPTQSTLVSSSFNVDALATEAEKHTIFLSSLVGIEKAFRVPVTVKKPSGAEVKIEKSRSQADQGSDMNVISIGMVSMLGLTKYLLADIGFKGLSMRTADHRDTVLQHWVWLHLGVEGIWRNIRCFVAPEVVSVTESGRTEYLGLILGIPWLYSVDASISIRLSTIFIGDRTIGEEVRAVVGPEMVFCKDHNLLMYPKSAMATARDSQKALPKASTQATVEEIDESSDSSSSDSEDDLSDIEEVPRDFQ